MDWTSLRNEFPVTRRWAFLDHAAVAAPTERARRALVEWTDDLAANGVVTEGRWLKRVEESRQLFGRLLNADPPVAALSRNTTEAINSLPAASPCAPGDNAFTPPTKYRPTPS